MYDLTHCKVARGREITQATNWGFPMRRTTHITAVALPVAILVGITIVLGALAATARSRASAPEYWTQNTPEFVLKFQGTIGLTEPVY